MLSGSGGIGSTLTSGIQDIAAILPLLSTLCGASQLCIYTRIYLRSSNTYVYLRKPRGGYRGGFKTLLLVRRYWRCKIWDSSRDERTFRRLWLGLGKLGKGRTRGDTSSKLEWRNWSRITGVSYKSVAWDEKTMATTALWCVFSIAPYIYLNLSANSLTKGTAWVFLILRATGGFITATLIQLLIQQRIITHSFPPIPCQTRPAAY